MANISLNGHACIKCGHTWFPKRGSIPKVCPKCHCRRWQGDITNTQPVADIPILKIDMQDTRTARQKKIDNLIISLVENADILPEPCLINPPQKVNNFIKEVTARSHMLQLYPAANNIVAMVDQMCAKKGKTFDQVAKEYVDNAPVQD